MYAHIPKYLERKFVFGTKYDVAASASQTFYYNFE